MNGHEAVHDSTDRERFEVSRWRGIVDKRIGARARVLKVERADAGMETLECQPRQNAFSGLARWTEIGFAHVEIPGRAVRQRLSASLASAAMRIPLVLHPN